MYFLGVLWTVFIALSLLFPVSIKPFIWSQASLIADQLWSKNQALVSNGFLVNQKFYKPYSEQSILVVLFDITLSHFTVCMCAVLFDIALSYLTQRYTVCLYTVPFDITLSHLTLCIC